MRAVFRPRRILFVSLGLAFACAAAILCGLSAGSSGLGPGALVRTLLGGASPDSAEAMIIRDLRFPRTLLAALAGGALALGGLIFQTLLGNPLAEPYILGISGGAAVGAVIGFLLGLARYPGVAALSFTGAAASFLLVFIFAAKTSFFQKDRMLLAGVVLNALFSAIILFLLTMTGDNALHGIIFWLTGDLSTPSIGEVSRLGLVLFPCFIGIFLLSKPMNLLLFGEEEARAMGAPVRAVRSFLFLTSSFMVAAVVCHCGLIGFVGLVIPHAFRLMLGPDHRTLIPACIFGGGAYLVLCDLLARVLPANGEMPVGVVTAMLGAPLFLFLLARSGR